MFLNVILFLDILMVSAHTMVPILTTYISEFENFLFAPKLKTMFYILKMILYSLVATECTGKEIKGSPGWKYPKYQKVKLLVV